MADIIIHVSFLEQTSSMTIQTTGYADRVTWVIKLLTDYKRLDAHVIQIKYTSDNIILNSKWRKLLEQVVSCVYCLVPWSIKKPWSYDIALSTVATMITSPRQ